MIIENISKELSNKLGDKLQKTDEEKAVLNYGLFIIIHTSLAIVLTFILGLVTNMLLEVMIITVSAAWMKRYSGGVHANTPNRCLIIGIVVSVVISYLNVKTINLIDENMLVTILILGSILSYIILYYKCPVGTKNKPLKNEKIRKKLRKKAFKLINIYIIIMCIGYIIYRENGIYIFKSITTCIWLGLLLQVSVLTELGKKMIMSLDVLLERMGIN